MSFLNERQRRTLEKICDTFVPKLIPEEGDEHTLFDFCASMHDVSANIERTESFTIMGLAHFIAQNVKSHFA